MIFDVLFYDFKVIELGAEFAGDSGRHVGIFLGQHTGGSGGIIIRTRLQIMFPEEILTLGKGLGMRKYR